MIEYKDDGFSGAGEEIARGLKKQTKDLLKEVEKLKDQQK